MASDEDPAHLASEWKWWTCLFMISMSEGKESGESARQRTSIFFCTPGLTRTKGKRGYVFQQR